MKFQLVLQWPLSSHSYDSLIEIEELLIENITNDADVDGHDFGSHEANIFIHTNNPAVVFDEVKSLFLARGLLNDLRAAYRDMSGNQYMVLWPAGLKQFDVV